MLKLVDICLEIDGKTVLDKVNLKIGNECVVVTGPNGAGKSSLCKIIAGIVTPTSGKVFFNDVDITDLSIEERAKLGVGYAFQTPVRFKGLTVSDLISIATSCDKGCVCEHLASVGLCAKDFANREFGTSVSGGEAKRIEIATVLARNPKLCLFDEPEAGVDLWSIDKLCKIFRYLADDGKCVILVSHQEKMLAIADKIFVLNGARLVQGTPDFRSITKCKFNKKRQV